jgi:hypothetical protein
LDQHQVPEPWSGDIEHAPILFLSSNPSFDENRSEEYPQWSDEWMADFFRHRFGGGRKQWIDEDGVRSLQWDGSRGKSVPFWREVRSRARELFERDVRPGVDYALTEVVHCKSKGQEGVKEALRECAGRYLQPVVALSGAKVIAVLGKQAEKAVRDEFRLSDGSTFGPLQISERHRYIVFLPHPSYAQYGHPCTFEECLDKETLQALRAFLRRE